MSDPVAEVGEDTSTPDVGASDPGGAQQGGEPESGSRPDPPPAADPGSGEASDSEAETAPAPSPHPEARATESGPEVPAPEPVATGPVFRVASLVSVQVDLPTEHPTVVLRETEIPRRQINFSVRLADGMMLSHVLRRIPTPRPLTPELLADVLRSFEIDVVATRLVGRTGAVYFAELDLRSSRGHAVLSCRPTDGIAAALLQPVPAPILVDARLFEGAGDVTPG